MGIVDQGDDRLATGLLDMDQIQLPKEQWGFGLGRGEIYLGIPLTWTIHVWLDWLVLKERQFRIVNHTQGVSAGCASLMSGDDGGVDSVLEAGPCTSSVVATAAAAAAGNHSSSDRLGKFISSEPTSPTSQPKKLSDGSVLKPREPSSADEDIASMDH